MRFLSCFVAGFGKLCNQPFDLNKDVVEIKAKNGSGKTTLAVFLESMLFGLEYSRSKNLSENPRLFYEPWQGGAFGGSLTFSHNGKIYRIERRFGKTPSADSVKLYDKNNALCYEFGENVSALGELLLGINRETYRKSAYIPQGAILGERLPEDTKARLASMLSVSGEKDTLAGGAIKRLEEAERKLRAKRAPAKGKIDELEAEIERLNRATTDCERATLQAREEKASVESLRQELALLKSEERIKPKKKRSGWLLLVALLAFGLGAVCFQALPLLALPSCIVGGFFAAAFALGKTQRTAKGNGKERERLVAELARREVVLENLEKQASRLFDYQAELERITEEKSRLEKRLLAITTAKELLIRARSNMAFCYLEPVERGCKQYLSLLSETDTQKLRFTAEGQPILDENGSLKPVLQYSAGTKDLIGFCTRLALAEAVFENKGLPVLVLDDPFVNFDDETTRQAKKLVRNLSKKYQIVYFTCSSERSL